MDLRGVRRTAWRAALFALLGADHPPATGIARATEPRDAAPVVLPGAPPLSQAAADPCTIEPASSTTTDAELRRRAVAAPCSIGSVSLGTPGAGALLNGVQLPEREHWVVEYPNNAWGTLETVTELEVALNGAFEGARPDAPKIHVGDLSTPWGGPLPPHASHQSGRDVDVGYARLRASDPWWDDASERTLDVVITWRLVRALVTHAHVEVIFMDRAVQRLIEAHARREGEDARWLDGLLDRGAWRPSALVRHVPGHTNHMHVRFRSPRAEHVGRVVRDLVAPGVPKASVRDR